jgi:hypothetical protein
MLAAVALVGTFQYCSSSKKSAAKQPEEAKLTFAANVLPFI